MSAFPLCIIVASVQGAAYRNVTTSLIYRRSRRPTHASVVNEVIIRGQSQEAFDLSNTQGNPLLIKGRWYFSLKTRYGFGHKTSPGFDCLGPI